jgi:autotransporter-associated beta strand protein
MKTLNFIIAAALLFLAAQGDSLAGSATWNLNPASGDWNTAANWTPATVPNGPSDIATFATSNQTQIGISAITGVGGINFNPGADAFTIISQPGGPFTLSGSGIVNNSGKLQTFVCESGDGSGSFFFENSATAGAMTSFAGADESNFLFFGTSSAGSAAFDFGGATLQSFMDFHDSSTAADATITTTLGVVSFFDNSTAANSHITLSAASALSVEEDAHGGHAVVTCIGGNQAYPSDIAFQNNATAEEGTYTAIGASTSGEMGSLIELTGSATADHAAFIINGGMGAGLEGTSLNFVDTTTAANANITANGGVDGSDGGVISFQEQSKGGKASISLSGNATLDISTHRVPGVTIGSLAGEGSVLLGANTLTIGSNNQSTTFSGVIQDSGGLTKTGTGTLTLTGANTYTGTTTVSAGTLQVSNNTGSGTGSGAVNVNVGTVGGKGIIAGAMTIGTGSGAGAFLAPAVGTNVQARLTIQSALTFNADATYTCTFRAKRNRASTDMVIANGVTINSGAMIALSGQTRGRLTTGLTLTLISNTTANPISGTFSDLPDGGIVTINGNNFQASYSGGDGNDLTLTVVP